MKLYRVKHLWDWALSPFGKYMGQEADSYETRNIAGGDVQEWRFIAHFHRFGEGKEARSDFDVWITWQDVSRMVDEFAKDGQQDAVAIREAMLVAQNIKTKTPSSPAWLPQAY